MRKLKSLLTEQFEIKKLVIKTPAPKSILAITDNIKPSAAAFVVKATEKLGETPDLNVIKTAIGMNERFGTSSIWARISKDPYVYIIGTDLKDSTRKLFFNVMIVPISWVYNQLLGEGHDVSLRDEIKLFSDTTFKIGNASIITQTDFDAELNRFKSSTKSAEEKMNTSQTQTAVDNSLKDPSAGNVIDNTTKDPSAFKYNPKLTIDEFNSLFPDGITLAEFSKPGTELIYKSIGAIQELMYQIGMKNPALNSIKEWVTFRDARADYGTAYGTRTAAFVKYLNKSIFKKDSTTLGLDLYEKLLEYKSKLNITESFIKLVPLITEQDLGFPIDPEASSFPVIDQPKASSASTKIVYPYTFKPSDVNLDSDIFTYDTIYTTVYTMSDTDPWAYIYNPRFGYWHILKKSRFEYIIANPKTELSDNDLPHIVPKSNTAVYNKLNKLLPAGTVDNKPADDNQPKKQSAAKPDTQTATQIGKMLTLKTSNNIQTYSEDTSGGLIPSQKIKAGPNKSLNKVKILQYKKLKNTPIAPAGTYYQIKFMNKKVWINSNAFN